MDSKSKIRLATTMVLAALAGGCMSMPQASVVSDDNLKGQRDDVNFWNRIDHVPMVSNADAVYAMSLYEASRGGAVPAADYPGRVAALKRQDLLSSQFGDAADAAVDRGTLARFVAVELKLPRGLTASVVGLNGRYAVRELEFRGLLPESSPNQIVTGAELVGVLARAEDFEEAMHAPAPGVRSPTVPSDARPASPAPGATAARPLPDISLVSRSLDAIMLDLDGPSAAPATAPAAASDDYFVVDTLQGSVVVQPPGATSFIPATVGMRIDGDTEISTGLKGTVTLKGPHNQTVSFKKLTRTTLRRYTSTGGINVTKVDMARGTTGAEIDNTPIEGVGQKYDLQVQSPRSTLAIKGTRVALYDQQPYDVEARSFTGTALFEQFDRQRVAFGRKGGGLVTVTGKTPDPTAVALTAATEDPSIRDARSDSEENLVANYFSRNTTIRFDRFTELPTITGGSIPASTEALRAFFDAPLNFGIEWTENTNVNIGVQQTTTGKLVYPYAALSRDSGGTIPFDHRGGSSGGFEVANITDVINGRYQLEAENLGSVPAHVTLTVFQGNTQLPVYLFDLNTKVTTTEVDPGQSFVGAVFVGPDGPPPVGPGGGIFGGDGGLIPQQRRAKSKSATPAKAGPPTPAPQPTPMPVAKVERRNGR